MRPTLMKPTPYRNMEYVRWIKLFPCEVCKAENAEAAHTGAHGLGTKASDFRCVPLCEQHHRSDKDGLDKIGPEEFERRYNINIRERILFYIEMWLATGHTL